MVLTCTTNTSGAVCLDVPSALCVWGSGHMATCPAPLLLLAAVACDDSRPTVAFTTNWLRSVDVPWRWRALSLPACAPRRLCVACGLSWIVLRSCWRRARFCQVLLNNICCSCWFLAACCSQRAWCDGLCCTSCSAQRAVCVGTCPLRCCFSRLWHAMIRGPQSHSPLIG
jgi:hypothetical protein